MPAAPAFISSAAENGSRSPTPKLRRSKKRTASRWQLLVQPRYILFSVHFGGRFSLKAAMPLRASADCITYREVYVGDANSAATRARSTARSNDAGDLSSRSRKRKTPLAKWK
jgi:hypothetical protein